MTDQVKPARKRPHGPQEYKGNGNHTWETVLNSDTFRMRVPGGWIYRRIHADALTFVPLAEVIGYDI